MKKNVAMLKDASETEKQKIKPKPTTRKKGRVEVGVRCAAFPKRKTLLTHKVPTKGLEVN